MVDEVRASAFKDRQLRLEVISAPLRAALAEAGIDEAALAKIAGQDLVIRGPEEAAQLLLRIDAIASTSSPGRVGDLAKAAELKARVLAELEPVPKARAPTAHGHATAGLRPPRVSAEAPAVAPAPTAQLIPPLTGSLEAYARAMNARVSELGVSFSVPEGLTVAGGPDPVTTIARTNVSLSLARGEMNLGFSPPLEIDATWPVSDQSLHSVRYDFAAGATKGVSLTDTDTVALAMNDSATASVSDAFDALMAKTGMHTAGYDPFQDPTPLASFKSLRSIASSGGAGGATADLEVSATFELIRPIDLGTTEAGLRLDANTSISIRAELGDGLDQLGAQDPVLEGLVIQSARGITLIKDGKEIARVHDLQIAPGGQVTVGRFTPLGELEDAVGTEAGLKLFASILTVVAAGELHAVDAKVSTNAASVLSSARAQMNKGLTEALQKIPVDRLPAPLVKLLHP